MSATFAVTVAFDQGLLDLSARRRGVSVERVQQEAVAMLECRLHDTAKWHDGLVERVDVKVYGASFGSSPAFTQTGQERAPFLQSRTGRRANG